MKPTKRYRRRRRNRKRRRSRDRRRRKIYLEDEIATKIKTTQKVNAKEIAKLNS